MWLHLEEACGGHSEYSTSDGMFNLPRLLTPTGPCRERDWASVWQFEGDIQVLLQFRDFQFDEFRLHPRTHGIEGKCQATPVSIKITMIILLFWINFF